MAFYSFTTPRLRFSQPIQDTSSQNAGFWQSGTRMKKSAQPQKYNNNKHSLTLVVFIYFLFFFYIHISKVYRECFHLQNAYTFFCGKLFFLYDCKPAPSVLWVCACSRVFMAGSVALERRIAVSLEGPVSPFVSQDAAGFRLMQNGIKISCSDARFWSICLSAHVTWQTSCFRQGPALSSAHREGPSSDGVIAVADVCCLGGWCCWRGKHIRESHPLSLDCMCIICLLEHLLFYGHCSYAVLSMLFQILPLPLPSKVLIWFLVVLPILFSGLGVGNLGKPVVVGILINFSESCESVH